MTVTVTVAEVPMVECPRCSDHGFVPGTPGHTHLRMARKGDVVRVPCPHRGEGGGIGGQQVTDFTCGVCGLTWASSSTAGRHPNEGDALMRLTEEPWWDDPADGLHLTGEWEDR